MGYLHGSVQKDSPAARKQEQAEARQVQEAFPEAAALAWLHQWGPHQLQECCLDKVLCSHYQYSLAAYTEGINPFEFP